MVLESAALGDDGAEDAFEASCVEGSGIALDYGVEDGGFAGFVGDWKVVLGFEACDFGYGLGSAVDEVQKFEV
jgi:hypothetical protein